MLVLHILIALSSLLWVTITYLQPTLTKLRISYGLMHGVVLSGIGVVFVDRTAMVQACTSGLAYLAVSLTATVFTRRKLALQLTK